MSRLGWVVVIALFVPQTSSAIQLRWSTGSTNLTFGDARQCTLLVQADPAEGTLPGQWRLLWRADSSGVTFVEEDSAAACSADTARVSAIEPPATTADSAAHQITTRFCSANEAAATVAVFVLDQPGWSKGSLKVVAIDPADLASTRVIESNEVTYNGGVEGTYAPNVLTTTQSRQAKTIRVDALGTGLQGLSQARIVASDTTWTVPLIVISQTGSSLTATAEVPAALPPAVLELSTLSGSVAVAPLAGDTPVAPLVDYSYGKFVSPEPGIWRPKDFSIFYDNLGSFHLFFMRQQTAGGTLAVQEKIGHVSGQTLRAWSPVDLTLEKRPTGWDSKYLWAPSLVQRGAAYYLFYTGVDGFDDQSIGVASTSNINTSNIAWTRSVGPIVSRANIPWIDPDGDAQCRDPFVMASPTEPNTYVMFYTTQLASSHKPAIGIATPASTDWAVPWIDRGRLEVVDVIPQLYGPYMGAAGKTESPHAFAHINASGDTSYYVVATGSDGAVPAHDRLLRNRRSPWDPGTDTGPDHWNLSSSVYDELGFADLDRDVFGGWEASEYCKMFRHEYLAAINYSEGVDSTAAIWIAMIQWGPVAGNPPPPDTMGLLGPVTAVGDRITAAPVHGEAELRLRGRNPVRVPVEMEVDATTVGPYALAVFDPQGRRVRQLASWTISAGRTTVSWDGRDAMGMRVASGVYFARLEWRGGHRHVRLVLLQ